MRALVVGLVVAAAAGSLLAISQRPASGLGDIPYGSYPVEMNVLDDPSGHQEFIDMPEKIKLTFRSGSQDDQISGPFPFVMVHADVDKEVFTGDWELSMSGDGTVANIEHVSIRLTGQITAEGVISGIYTMGYENDLPGGQPIEYRIKANGDPLITPPVPTATRTPTPTSPNQATATPPTPTATTCVAGRVAGQQCTAGTPTSTPSATPPPSGGDGDCDHNSTTNSLDALLVLQYTAGLIPHPGGCGDVNRDNLVNAIDGTLILQYIADFIDHLPWP